MWGALRKIDRRYVWALAATVLSSSWAGAAWAAERVALVIGNAAYEHTEALKNPGNDAADMAAKLRSLGFKVVVGTDLDLDGFYDKLGNFDDAASGADVTLFFYAGHGLQVEGKNWLVPTDAKLEKKLDLRRGAVELDTVLESMRGTKKLVLLDACRDNPLAGDLARSMGLSRSVAAQRGLARVESERGSGMLIGYATAPGGVADDGGGRNSPFTTALLEHIATPGLSVDDMLTRVTQSVLAATGRKQEPWKHSSLSEIFYFKPSVVVGGGGDGTLQCRTVQVPKTQCRTVTRYRREIREEPYENSVETAFKIGPHFGFTDTACQEGERKIRRRLERKCDDDEDLTEVESWCKGCDYTHCYLEAYGYCVGTKETTERVPYYDEVCEEVMTSERQCSR